ncbi:type III secretion system export apparatus subunit SctT [Sphingomonas sp. SUN019]|uniref:type III secretion system export apparatus subunit SctT n=1 Tax=Sphingomonas sp. SUN019 TaxID=2937788 RepID=UPI002164B5C8|nr:type III secretion system export apparatus subunit SctT [Sphingomonas sp. SUN019]UVO50021.1 type III secretion system export apparatus subunit SctT [Sphingomonas sp. SUN019]
MNGWADQVLLLGVATARVAATFFLLPMFSSETVPALVRNSIFVSLGVVSLAMQPPLDISMLGPGQWATILIKEVFVGLLIGFFFGSVLWALEAAGQIIDTKVGATLAQVVDPLSGHQTSLNGAFLGRLAGVVFVSMGGLSLLLRVIMESYALWPVAAPMPALDPRGLGIVEGEFGRMMVLATLFAAPVLTVLFLIDAGLGLMNRFAQQLNVFTLSLSIKAFAATFLLLLLLGSYITAIIRDIASRPAVINAILKGLGG